MASLSIAKGDVPARLANIMARFHEPLVDAEVTVGVLFAYPAEGQPHTVKLHGYPCAAVVKITPYRLRVQGVEDAVITIDYGVWMKLAELERDALLDHELQHLALVLDKKDQSIKSDDIGRPRLKMRLHDWELGGFEVVANRHKGASLEANAFRDAHEHFYQSVFAWGDDSAPADDVPTIRKAI